MPSQQRRVTRTAPHQRVLSARCFVFPRRNSTTKQPAARLEVRDLRAPTISGWRVLDSPLAANTPALTTEANDMSEPTYEELKAKLAQLEKDKEGRRSGALEFRVGEKGGVSVYGLGRFPFTLYYEQWIRLLDTAPELRQFLESAKSDGKLKLKEK